MPCPIQPVRLTIPCALRENDPARSTAPRLAAAACATVLRSETASLDAATAALYPERQKCCARRARPHRDPSTKAAASPTRYTSRKNRPKKSDKSSGRPHESEIHPALYSLRSPSPPAAKKSSDAPIRLRPSPRTAPSREFREPPPNPK